MNLSLRNIFQRSWQVYRARFWLIAAIVIVVWAPLELLIGYVDTFVFGEEEARKSWRFTQLLNMVFGIISSAGITFLVYRSEAGEDLGFRGALLMGFLSWGRIFWTKLIASIMIILGLVLLIIPGIYLMVRLYFLEPVVVCERISGTVAIQRSLQLTQGRFWFVFRLGLLTIAIFILPPWVCLLPSMFIPALDHWLIVSAALLVGDVLTAFGTVTVTIAYLQLASTQASEVGSVL